MEKLSLIFLKEVHEVLYFEFEVDVRLLILFNNRFYMSIFDFNDQMEKYYSLSSISLNDVIFQQKSIFLLFNKESAESSVTTKVIFKYSPQVTFLPLSYHYLE
jgi:hypothetical protein